MGLAGGVGLYYGYSSVSLVGLGFFLFIAAGEKRRWLVMYLCGI